VNFFPTIVNDFGHDIRNKKILQIQKSEVILLSGYSDETWRAGAQ